MFEKFQKEETHLRATIWDHMVLPPPDTDERAPPQPLPDRPVIDLPTRRDGRLS